MSKRSKLLKTIAQDRSAVLAGVRSPVARRTLMAIHKLANIEYTVCEKTQDKEVRFHPDMTSQTPGEEPRMGGIDGSFGNTIDEAILQKRESIRRVFASGKELVCNSEFGEPKIYKRDDPAIDPMFLPMFL